MGDEMRWLLLITFASIAGGAAEAQTLGSPGQDESRYVFNQDQPSRSSTMSPSSPSGRMAHTGVGQIGQRQTREQAAPNVEPLSRINNRIANRVQNRIRNRIDGHSTPQANATSPFSVAVEQARIAGRQNRR